MLDMALMQIAMKDRHMHLGQAIQLVFSEHQMVVLMQIIIHQILLLQHQVLVTVQQQVIFVLQIPKQYVQELHLVV